MNEKQLTEVIISILYEHYNLDVNDMVDINSAAGGFAADLAHQLVFGYGKALEIAK